MARVGGVSIEDRRERFFFCKDARINYCRLAQTAMTKNKPTLVVSSTFELWVGNEGHDEITVTRDIMGFHKGDYSEKVVAGPADEKYFSFKSLLHITASRYYTV